MTRGAVPVWQEGFWAGVVVVLSQRSRVGVGARIASGLDQAGDGGRREHRRDERERRSGGYLGYGVMLLVGEFEDELGADEGEDRREAG